MGLNISGGKIFYPSPKNIIIKNSTFSFQTEKESSAKQLYRTNPELGRGNSEWGLLCFKDKSLKAA